MTIIFDGTLGITTPTETANNSVTTPVVKSSTNLVFQTNGTTEAMRIDTAQNVGIGTASPSSYGKFAVSGQSSLGVDQTDYVNVLGGGGTARVEAVGGNSNINLALSTKGTGAFYIWRGGYGGTNTFLIDGSGRVTMPSQPSFYAWSGVGDVAFTTETPLPLNSTLWNTGSHYNTSNYRFTAPVAGKYFFRANIYKQGNGNYSRLRIQKNNVSYTYHLILASAAETLTITSIVDMAVNDYVTCTFQADGGGASVYMASDHTSFSGFLIG